MKNTLSLTEGKILHSLTRFAMPVALALLLQALYGGIDLLIVGRFSTTADVSGVATGSMVMHTITMVITGLAMGITVIVGQRIGEGKPDEAGKAIGSGICFFAIIAFLMTFLIAFGSDSISQFMHAPEEAFTQTSQYIMVCGLGSVFIVAYNVLGSIFRGLGDSVTPLITVAIACVLNIAGNLLFVAIFDMGAMGAGIATVISQAISVIISFLFYRVLQRIRQNPFRNDTRFSWRFLYKNTCGVLRKPDTGCDPIPYWSCHAHFNNSSNYTLRNRIHISPPGFLIVPEFLLSIFSCKGIEFAMTISI